jgi:hypothetical protein
MTTKKPQNIKLQNKCKNGVSKRKLCDDNSCEICFQKSFASNKLSKYWHTTNNKTPRECFKNSHEKYDFKCPTCNHIINIALNKVNSNRWCSYCHNNKLCDNEQCVICRDKSFATSPKAKYWSLNNIKKPWQVTKNSNTKYKFDCDCGHSFMITPNSITTRGSWCPYSSDPPRKLCEDRSCVKCYEKSFSSHEASKYWSSINIIDPRFVFMHSNIPFFFDCKCGHVVEAVPNQINKQKDWCSFCNGRELCDYFGCEHCEANSFFISDKAEYWSPKNDKTPRDVGLYSLEEFYFICDTCNDETKISPYEISKKDDWCEHCNI